MRHYYFTVLFVALAPFAFSQSSSTFIGPRANGVGYAASCLADTWSIFNNPAGLSAVHQPHLGVTYDATAGFAPFNRMAVAFSTPFLKGGLGAGIYRFGDDLYNEQLISAGYANKFGISSLGVRIQYVQYHTEGFGTKGVVTYSAGGITELAPWLTIGALIVNANQPEISENEKIPTFLILGLQIQASDNVIILGEVEKNISEAPLIKAGLEYRIHKKLSLRTGFTPSPVAGYFGFSFELKKMEFGYTFSYLSGFASKHQAGFLYKLKASK